MDQERDTNPVLGTEKKKRRQLSAETKYTIFLEAGRGDVPVAEVLRKHGIHSSELQRIREKVRLGALKELSGKSRSAANTNGNNEAVQQLAAEKARLEGALLELTIEHQLLKKKTS
jgi:transposase-like protein